MVHRHYVQELEKDLGFIALGIFIAIILMKLGLVDRLLSFFDSYEVLMSFVAGIFFTSAFTIGPSSIVLVSLADSNPLWVLVISGGLGAMFGDALLFLFIKDRFALDLLHIFKKSKLTRELWKSLHFGFMKWLLPLVGALVIISPLPDEIGLALLGFSRMRLTLLLPIAFVMNSLGIAIMVYISRLI